MTSLEQRIRDLGELLYAEYATICASVVVEGSAAFHRKVTVELAMRWNALALRGVA